MNKEDPNRIDDTILKDIISGKFRDCYLIYNRKSTDELENQKNSLKYQKSENTRSAYKEHLPIAPVTLSSFCVDGIISEKHSGFKEDSDLVFGENGTVQYRIERPKFYQLIQFLNRGYFKGVIVLCWDRISRNKGDDTIIRKLMKQGVDFRFVLASYDKTSAGALHMDIDGMFAEHNSRVTSEKVSLNIKSKRDQGICTYKAPVGYLNLGQMENKPIDPIRAPIIAAMFEMYTTGEWSFADLARWAVEQGFTMPPSRRKRTKEERLAEEEDDVQIAIEPICRPPSTSTIHEILNNRFYIGETKGNDGRYVHSNSHKALISIELFESVQRILKKRKISVHYIKRLDHPMRGILRCDDCGRVYTPYPKKGILYLGCRCRNGCTNSVKSINIHFLSNIVGECIKGLFFTDAEKEQINAREHANSTTLQNEERSKQEVLERKKKKVKEDILYIQNNKLTLLKAGVYTPESLVHEEAKLNKQLMELSEDDSIQVEMKDIIQLSELLKKLYLYYEKANPHEKDKIMRILFSELTLSGNSLKYKCKSGFMALQNRFTGFCAHNTWTSELTKVSKDLICESIKAVETILISSAADES